MKTKIITFSSAFYDSYGINKNKILQIPYEKKEYMGTYTNKKGLENFAKVYFGDNAKVSERLNEDNNSSDHLGTIHVYIKEKEENYLFDIYKIDPNEF